MSLDNTIAKYEISIVRTGDGAAAAADDFKQVEQAANAANVALNTNHNFFTNLPTAVNKSKESIHELHLAGKLGTATLHELHTTGLLLGMESMPGLTMAIQGATTTIHTMRAASKLLEVSLGTVSFVVAGVIAAITTATFAWEAHKAKLEEVKSAEDAHNSLLRNRAQILSKIADLVKSQDIMIAEGSYYTQRLLAPGLSDDQLLSRMREAAQDLHKYIMDPEQENALKRISAIEDQMTTDRLEGFEKERFEANKTYGELAQQIKALAQVAYPTMDILHMGKNLDMQEGLVAGVYRARAMKMQEIDEREAAKHQEEIAREEAQQQVEAFQMAQEEIKSLEDDLTIKALSSKDDRVTIANQEYDARVQLYEDLFAIGSINEDKFTELSKQATIKRLRAEEKEEKFHLMTIQQMEVQAAEGFSQGFASAFVDFVSGTKSASQAFQEFAKQFLESVAQMIMQQVILNGLRSAFFGGGGVAVAAAGGVFPTMAAAGLAGVSSVSSPTYFPKFNVVAGEAGREMLTVLARPRMMSLGGIEAVVGQAGKNSLAITSAESLARASGVGGHILIEIAHSDQATARIVSNSVQGAEVRIIQQAQRSSAVRDAIRKAAA